VNEYRIRPKEKPIYVKADTVLKIGQRVEISLSGDTRAFASRLEDIQTNSLALARPLDVRNNSVTAAPGDIITCKVFGGSCYYKFSSIYQRMESDNIILWYVGRPDEVQKLQYRDFVRLKTTLPLTARPVNENGVKEDPCNANTIDISGGGLSFSLPRPLVVGTKVSIEIDNVPGIGLFDVMTTVVRSDEVEVKGTKVYHIGVRYINLNPNTQNKLVNFIFELQRQLLAKGLESKSP